MSEINCKPAMYLDQNILDKLLKKATNEHLLSISSRWQIVYSEFTLGEIYKAVNNSKRESVKDDFLSLLTSLNAKFFCLPDVYINQKADAVSLSLTPREAYDLYLENRHSDKNLINLSNKQLLAIYDGIRDYDEFEMSLIQSMSDLKQDLYYGLETLNNELNTCSSNEEKTYIQGVIDSYNWELKNLESQFPDFEKNVKFTNDKFKEANQKLAINKSLRQTYNINIDNLKKIEGRNALIKIFEYLDKSKPYDLPSLGKEWYKIITDESLRVFARIGLIYDFLNLIGYYPDESLNKENRFFSSLADKNHAMSTCFCDIFVSNDTRFTKKVKVAFEHFNIATRIYSLEIYPDKFIFQPIYDIENEIF